MKFDNDTHTAYTPFMNKSFADTIKQIRKRTGLSQTQFAKLVKINKRTLEGWEQDRWVPDNSELLLAGIRFFIAKEKK